MRILMLHPHDIYSPLEPWTVRIVSIAKEFVRDGHAVKLIYFPLEWEKRRPVETIDGIERIPLSRRFGPFVFLSNIFRVYCRAGWADVIHFQKCFYHAALPALIAGFLRRKHLHYDWDDWEVRIYDASAAPGKLKGPVKRFLDILERRIPLVADTVSVASARLRIECESLGVEKGAICDAHVGADTAHFHPGISGESVRKRFGITQPLVLYLGQLHGGQYVELFIKTAAKIIGDCRRDVCFMIVGDGYQAAELRKMAQQLNLNGALTFAGAVPHDAVPGYIAAADICVACFEENDVTACKSPLKIVEYLASGKAIVASRVGEVPAMLRDAGVLTPPGDVDALAAGILEVLDNTPLRLRLERAARVRAEEEYNWRVTAGNLLSAYRQGRRPAS